MITATASHAALRVALFASRHLAYHARNASKLIYQQPLMRMVKSHALETGLRCEDFGGRIVRAWW